MDGSAMAKAMVMAGGEGGSRGPPVAIPGYDWDAERQRYFKALPRSHDSSSGPNPGASASDSKGKRKASQTDDASRHGGTGRPLFGHSQSKKAASHRRTANEHVLLSAVGDPPPVRLAEAKRLQERFYDSTFTCPRGFRTVYPTVLPLGEDITSLHPVPPSPSSPHPGIRIGGSRGTIARGHLPGDEQNIIDEEEAAFLGWPTGDDMGGALRMEWAMGSCVTSLGQCGATTIATALGPPAQCTVSLSSGTVSTASITLSPHKTSLWSSSLSPTSLALGCDSNVLVADLADLARGGQDGQAAGRGGMVPYPTKSAVYAVEQSINMIYAGTRGGKVLVFDRRSSRPQYRYTDGAQPSHPRPVMHHDGAVTHMRLLNGDRHLLVAGTTNHLALHDLRFLSSRSSRPSPNPYSSPLLQFTGHVNAYLRDLGFTVLSNGPTSFPGPSLVIAAGQDRRVRAWSLLDGRPLEHLKLSPEGADRVFGEPVKAITTFDDWPLRRDGDGEGREEDRRGKSGGKGPCIVVADGAMLQCTSVFP